MTGYIIGYDGRVSALPPFTAWSFTHTAEDGADAFEVTMGYEPASLEVLSEAVRFRAEEKGECVFCGIVDEYEAAADGKGCFIRISGRGMGGVLLDNEAEAGTYLNCTLEDIVREHTAPYGITADGSGDMGSLKSFTVKSGWSEWRALTEFCRWAGDAAPRFSRDGRLVIGEKGGTVVIGAEHGVCSAGIREKRYGVVSEVLVKGNTNGKRTVVKNEEFIKQGGRCRRIISVPNRTGYDARRYTGEYTIEQSAKDCCTVTLGFGSPLAAFAGDTARVHLPEMGIEGEFFIKESVSWADGAGCGTELTMTRR